MDTTNRDMVDRVASNLPASVYSRLNDLLALSHVPRWAIVPHSRPQTVSDHTFRVLVIALELTTRLRYDLPLDLVLHIITHDVDESRTGDIPTPAKKLMAVGGPRKYCPWLALPELKYPFDKIFRLSDLLEAYTFIATNGTGRHADRVGKSLLETLHDECPPEWSRIVTGLECEIMVESGR